MVDTGNGENTGDKGMTEVGLPESAVDIELLHGEGLDCGIFEVNCYLKDE